MYVQTRDGAYDLWVEVSGKPSGIPVLVMHGGPGGSIEHVVVDMLNQKGVFRVLAFDQRGCGKSTCKYKLEEEALRYNTTDKCLDDMEHLTATLFGREKKFGLVGVSWGGTLGILYAKQHAERLLFLLLVCPWLARRIDYDYVYAPTSMGGPYRHPEEYEQFIEVLPGNRQGKSVSECYWEGVHSAAWRIFVGRMLYWSVLCSDGYEVAHEVIELVVRSPQALERCKQDAIVNLWYECNQCWLGDRGVLEPPARIVNVPVVCIQGANDYSCQPDGAACLQQIFPKMELHFEAGGHQSHMVKHRMELVLREMARYFAA